MSGSSRARTLAVQLTLAAAVLALFTPVMAHANTITTTILNKDGKAGTAAVGTTGPFSLDSDLTSINGAAEHGSVMFTTGSTFAGSLQTGGTWNSLGSTFTISESGMGTVFTGTFTGTVTWTLDGCNGDTGSCTYGLNGGVSGTYKGHAASGGTVQLYLTTMSNCTSTTESCAANYYNGGYGHSFLLDSGGTTTLQYTSTVPEPGSMFLMGTGLLSLGFSVRRRLLSWI